MFSFIGTGLALVGQGPPSHFVTDRSMKPAPTVTTVNAEAALSVSSPSGMVLSGSTYAVFVTIIGRLGAKAVMTMVRVAGAPGSTVAVPLRVAPEQVIT